MLVDLAFVPPGGGETDYWLQFDLPALPRPGDYIRITRPPIDKDAYNGSIDFLVRKTIWHLDYPNNEIYSSPEKAATGSTTGIVVECEFSLSPYSSESHKQACDVYTQRGYKVQVQEATAY